MNISVNKMARLKTVYCTNVLDLNDVKEKLCQVTSNTDEGMLQRAQLMELTYQTSHVTKRKKISLPLFSNKVC